MNCKTCTYRCECPSDVIDPDPTGNVIDLNEYRRVKALESEEWEDKLFDAIDDTLTFLCWWIIGGGAVLIIWNLLRGWMG